MDEHNIPALSKAQNEMVMQGHFLEAIQTFFASDCRSIDFDRSVTTDLAAKTARAVAITRAIKNINAITLHHTTVSGNVAFAEYTFDFDMKDGSRIYWHEVIRTIWRDGKVIEEQYFKS
jgi:hypothetical protein